MKRRLLITAVAVLALSLAAYATMAYLTGGVTAHNVITAGNVEIKLLDRAQTENGEIAFPPEGVQVMPGTTASKEVSVKNEASECWVRVKLVKEITLKNQETIPVDQEQDPLVLDLNVGEGSKQWTLANGYYYYNSPLAKGNTPGDTTEKLFTTVTFDKGMGNEYQNARLTIQVYAEAVQSANNPIPPNGNVTQVLGWPTTPAVS